MPLYKSWEYLIKEVRKTKVSAFLELPCCREEKNSQKDLTNECSEHLKLTKCSDERVTLP